MLPTSLEVLDLSGGDPAARGLGSTPHKFTGRIPPEWGALANLKELKMAVCGLDGKPLSIRAEWLRVLLTFHFFGRTIARAARPTRKFGSALATRQRF